MIPVNKDKNKSKFIF